MDRFLQVRSSNENAKKMQVEHHYPRSLLFALAFFGATLASCNNSDGGGPKEGNNNPAPISTPDSVNTADSINIPDSIMLDSIKPNNYQLYPIYERAITEELDSITIGENQKDKKLFLCKGENQFTEEFDDITLVGSFDGIIYYVGIRDGKPKIMDEKGKTISSGFDEIDDYIIQNGNIAVIGKKNEETCLMYNGHIIDRGKEYKSRNRTYGSVNGIYTTATIYDKKNGDKRVKFFVNGKQVGQELQFVHYENGHYYGDYYFGDFGNGYIITGDKTIICNGKTIGNLEDLQYGGKNKLPCYKKNGENYVLGKDGKEYKVTNTKSFDKKSGKLINDLKDDSSSLCLLVKDSNNNDYYYLDGKFHKLEGENYRSIIAYGNTPDGKPFFIGWNDKGETLEIEGEIVGSLPTITCVGTSENGTHFVKGRNREIWGCSEDEVNLICTKGGGTRTDLDPGNDSGVWLIIVYDNYDGSTRMDYCGTK